MAKVITLMRSCAPVLLIPGLSKSMVFNMYSKNSVIRHTSISLLYTRETYPPDKSSTFNDFCTTIADKKKLSKLRKIKSTNHVSEQILDRLLNGNLSYDFWKEMEEYFVEKNYVLNSHHWPSLIMILIRTLNATPSECLRIADCLKAHMLEHGPGENLITLSAYMALLGKFGFRKEEPRIMELYNEICAQTNNLFEPGMVQLMMEGLEQTSEWKKGYTLLKYLDIFGQPYYPLYNHLIAGAVLNNEIDHVWSIFNTLYEVNRVPTNSSFRFLLENCTQTQFDEVLRHLAMYQWCLDKDNALLMATRFQDKSDESWTYNLTYVDRKCGCCVYCGHTLENVDRLSESEFSRLRVDIMEKALQREDIYLISTPEELAHFTTFLDKQPRKFDAVLDGMNIMYKSRNKGTNDYDMVINFLQRIIGTKGWNVLLTLRKHMRTDRMKRDIETMKNVTIYYTNDNTSDDPYFIYAAFHSGPDCCVVTYDYLRSEAFLLGTAHSHLFKCWQRTNQYLLCIAHHGHKRLIIMKNPVVHRTAIQSTPDGSKWHIPFEDNFKRPSYLPTNAWLCMKRQK